MRLTPLFLTGLVVAAPTIARGDDPAHHLLAADGAAGDQLFLSLAASDTIVLAGASLDDDNGSNSGSAYVFSTATGQELRKLLPADGSGGDFFGNAVALDGTTGLIGAYLDRVGQEYSGSAYIFDVSTGEELFRLSPGDGVSGDQFGYAVAVDGTTALVSAPSDDDNGTDSGSVYVFDTVTGQELSKLTPSDGESGDLFGTSVALHGNLALVGSWGDDDRGNGAGAAYLFDVPTGQQLHKLLPDPSSKGAHLGVSAALDGELAVLGANGDDAKGDFAGSVYVFDVSSGQKVATLYSEDLAPGDRFGASVDIEGATILVGANLDDDHGLNSGAAYLFDRAALRQLVELTPADGAAGDAFGGRVALAGDRIVVAAPGDDDQGTDSGSAYVFDLHPRDATAFCFGSGCPCGNDDPGGGCVGSSGKGATMTAYGSASVSCDDLVLRVESLPLDRFGIFFMGDAQAPAPFGNGLRCAGSSLYRYLPPQNTGATGTAQLGPGIVGLSCSTFGSGGCITVASSWVFQFWYRDAGGPCGDVYNASNAVAVVFAR